MSEGGWITSSAQNRSGKTPDMNPTFAELHAQASSTNVKPRGSKSTKRLRATATVDSNTYSLDINDYYDNKYKLEYMNREVERLNNKVERLRQYKKLVNKLSGVDYDEPVKLEGFPIHDVNITQPVKSNRTTGIASKYNDSLFLY